MLGLGLGLVCGGVELYLLQKLVKRVVTEHKLPVWILPVKVFCLAFFFVPCGFFFPAQLPWTAAGTAMTLVAGAVIRFLAETRQRKHTEASIGKEDPA